jgi:DNA-directed RNA polymerase specialized sigma24 family protein
LGHEEQIDRGAVRRAQDGDHAACSVLVRHYQDRVYRYLLRLTGSHDEALELTQEAFIKAWEALPAWRPEAQFRTWLFRIASNAAMDTLRRRKVIDFVPLPEDYLGFMLAGGSAITVMRPAAVAVFDPAPPGALCAGQPWCGPGGR